MTNHSKDIDMLLNIISNKQLSNDQEEIDYEIPTVRKSKRSIDKIHKDTGEVIATYDSIEAAGRSMGLTTGTAIGIAVRENGQCRDIQAFRRKNNLLNNQ